MKPKKAPEDHFQPADPSGRRATLQRAKDAQAFALGRWKGASRIVNRPERRRMNRTSWRKAQAAARREAMRDKRVGPSAHP